MSGFKESPFYNGGGGGYLSQDSPRRSGGGSPGGSGRQATAHSIRPVTLKQLLGAQQEHSDAPWKIGDVELGQVTIVAQVLSVQTQTTNVVYMLNDGTTGHEARQWVDVNNDSEGGRHEIQENTYVRVSGVLKVFGQKRYINASHIREIPQKQISDELFFHIADTAMTQLIFERGPPPRPSEGSRMPRANGYNAGGAGGTSAYATASHASAASSNQYAGLPALEREIVNYMLSQPRSEEGTHVAAIARHVANTGALDASKISQALDKLMDEGHVYSTIDESHFTLSE